MSKIHKIVLGGVELVPDLSGALYVPYYETLIISDLHLEQGSSLARRGIHMPPFDTAVTLALLETVVAAANPKRLIFLGDSFHDVQGEARLEASYINVLRRLTSSHETIWICGNHDPEPPQSIGGQGAETLSLGPLTLRHEPSPPSPSSRRGEGGSRSETGGEFSAIMSTAIAAPSDPSGHLPPFGGRRVEEYEIAGHLHPGCGINQRGRRIYGKCFVSDDTRLIMPAFGAYTGGLSITSKAFHGLLNPETAQAHMIGRAALHRFNWARLTG